MSRESDPINIFENPIAQRRAQKQRNLEVNGLKPDSLTSPKSFEKPKLISPYETPHFRLLSSSKQRKIRRGITLGYVDPEEIRDEQTLNEIDEDSAVAQHEVYHDAGLMGVEKRGVQRLGMTIVRSSDYRGATFFAINPNIPIATRAWIILVTAAASGAPDIFDYGYTHAGRGSDESQVNYAKGGLEPGVSVSDGRAAAVDFVKYYATEEKIWQLTRKKIA